MKFKSNNTKAREAREAKTTTGLKEIIITAFLTSLFTLTTSYFLIFNQLDMEHEYWQKRSQSERLTNLLDRRINLMASVNENILLYEILAENFKFHSIDFITNLKMIEQEKPSNELLKDLYSRRVIFQKKSDEIKKHVYILSSQLQMVETYFGNDVDELIQPLSDAIEKNYSNNLVLGAPISKLDASSLTELLKKDRRTIQILTTHRLRLITEMRAEIEVITKLLFNNYLNII